MATPLTADQLLAALRAEGLKVIEHPGWRTHNRNGHGEWGPVHGLMLHHTVTGKSVNGAELCFNGHAELPGPLCHSVIRRDGAVVMVSAGRANHAGGGSPAVLQAVINESYNDWPPDTHHHQGSSGAVDGNARFYGAECENLGDGKDPWSAAQVEAMVRWSAALCRAHKWGAKSAIAHKEWSDWKSDPSGPGMPTMPEMRRRIAERLSHPASWTKPVTPPAPKPPAPSRPKPPTTVTGMNLVSLNRSEDIVIPPGDTIDLYWTGETYDPGQAHGDGNKTVMVGPLMYTGTLYLNTSGTVRVVNAEEDSAGAQIGTGDWVPLGPTGDSTSFTGKVGQRLKFLVSNPGTAPVTVYFARAQFFYGPLV